MWLTKNYNIFARYFAGSVIASASMMFCFQPLMNAESVKNIIPDEVESEEINPCGVFKPLTLREAIGFTLENQMRIKIALEEVNRQRGIVQETAGPFDPETGIFVENTKIDNSQNGSIFTTRDGDVSTVRVSESKQFRLGTRLEVGAELNQVKDPANYPLPYNEGTLNFSLTQPLLQGFVYGLNATTEMASKEGYKATYYQAMHTISEQVLQATINYWNVVEAQKLVAIRKASVDAFEQLYKKTMRLIERDQLAKSELNQPLANLATAQTFYTQSKQILYTRMQLLKLSLGMIPTSCISTSLFEAVEEFPESISKVDFCKYMEVLVCNSLSYRNDLIALKFRETEIQYVLMGVNNELLPELDVFYNYDVNNYKRGRSSRKFLSGYDINKPRRGSTIGVSFSIPFYNDEAKGKYRRVSADLNAVVFEILSLKQTIISEVQELWMNYQRLLIETEESKIAASKFEQLVKDESQRLSGGVGSLFNLIDYQNRFTESQEIYISKQRDHAENIARIHYATGLLVSPNSNLCFLNVGDVLKLPAVKGEN